MLESKMPKSTSMTQLDTIKKWLIALWGLAVLLMSVYIRWKQLIKQLKDRTNRGFIGLVAQDASPAQNVVNLPLITNTDNIAIEQSSF